MDSTALRSTGARLLLCLLAAGGSSALGNGPRPVALFAWLAPIFFLRFFDLAAEVLSPRRRLAIAGGMNTLAIAFAMRGMVPAPLPVYAAMSLMIGFGSLVPVVLHTTLRPRLPAWLGAWVLGVAMAGSDHLASRLQPFGSWGAIAYSQAGMLPLLQSAAVAGLWLIPLLIGLVAAGVAEALRVGWREPGARRGLLLGLGLLAITMVAGQARLSRARGRLAASPPQRVAVSVVASPEAETLSTLLKPLYETGPASVRWPEIFAQAARVRADLLTRTEGAARAGARIVLWQETAAILAQTEEAAFLDTAGELARKHGIYVAAALGTVLRTERAQAGDKILDNHVVLIGPEGRPVARYRKAVPVPGAEAELIPAGVDAPPIVPTPFGRIALLICFDLDFPAVVRSVGARGADLILAPAEDWRAIDPYHSRMAALRAVENGLSLVRAARYGLSLAVDPYGQTIASSDYFLEDPQSLGSSGSPWPRGELLAAVPIAPAVPTFYTQFGDWLGWLCSGWLVLLSLWALRVILLR